jgi:hypothetical protein
MLEPATTKRMAEQKRKEQGTTMGTTLIAYVALAINPFGGILIAIPLALLQFDLPLVPVVLSAPLLAYVQVPVVDLAWTLLERIPAWNRLLERRRSPRVERLLAGGGAFWTTFFSAPLIGPWAVMAFMRYARVRQRRVALPILLSMAAVTMVVTALCLAVPAFFDAAAK